VRLSPMMGLSFLHLLFCVPLLIWVYVGFQTMMYYAGDTAYELGSPQMKEAYTVYAAALEAYEDYKDPEGYLQELESEQKKVESQLQKHAEGVVDENLPSYDECKTNKVAIDAKIVTIKEIIGEKSADEAKFILKQEETAQAYVEAYRNYELYRSSEMKSNVASTLLIMIPLIGIAGIGSTGQMYVLRNWARDEHSFMWQDYKAAIKNNWKQGLVIGLLNGLSIYLCFIGFVTYGQMSETSGLFFEIPKWLMVMLLIIWWMMNEIVFPMMVTYDMKVTHLIRNSFIMVLARLPISFLILLGTVALPLLISLLLPPQFSMLILILFYGLIGFSLTGFIYASYANSLFDKFLNPRIEGAEVNKGLRIEEDDDDDDDENSLSDGEVKPDRFWERKS